MPKYKITMEETVVTVVSIEAETLEQAEELVMCGEFNDKDIIEKIEKSGYYFNVASFNIIKKEK